MAIAAVSAAETRLCGNCKKDIPAVNFLIHEIHCSRNIEVCCYCRDSIPKSEMKKHIESEHVQVICKCNMKIENGLLKDHEASACPLRPALCQFCDIPLAFHKLQEHEEYCGARTETCRGCGQNVLLRELKEHPPVCGQEGRQARGSRAAPRLEEEDGDFTLRDISSQLRSEDELEQLERNENTHSSLDEEWDRDLDYMLALSLQSGHNPPSNTAAGMPRDFWEGCYTKEPVPAASLCDTDRANLFSCDSLVSYSTSDHIKTDETIMLPCEFCEELYPAEDLILHQTGCNPASAFASFSKRSPSPNPQEFDGLCALGSKTSKPLSSQSQAVQTEGTIMIPCEFCGVQLEEETLFIHQLGCALRPAGPPGSRQRRDSPELARRRARHQGDVSPGCTGGFGQQRLSCPARGNKSLHGPADTRKAPSSSSSSSGRARDGPEARGEPRRAAASGGSLRSRGTGRAGPAQSSRSGAFPPSSSRGGSSSPGTAGGAGGFRRRSTKVKAQSPGSTPPEK